MGRLHRYRMAGPLLLAASATCLSVAGTLLWVAELWSAAIALWVVSTYQFGAASLMIARRILDRKGSTHARKGSA